MKTGYSILLGEYVDAEVLEYRDCEPFQIVCPVCSEPLFKVARAKDEGATEYLSHYRRADAYDANCELRVDASASSDRERHNTQSRNQKLEYFLGVFRSALEEDPAMSYPNGLEKGQKQLNKSKALGVIRESHRATAKKAEDFSNYGMFKETVDFYIKEAGGIGEIPITGFSIATQSRIAFDLMKLLLTEKSTRNYHALFNHSAIFLLHRCAMPNPASSAVDAEIVSSIAAYLSGLIQRGTRAGMEILQEMMQRPVYNHEPEPSNYLNKLGAEVAHEMIGTLVRLPYFSLLKRRGAAGVPR